MNWQQISKDDALQDLPYQIELNQWGQIILTPMGIKHGAYQFQIGQLLAQLSNQGQCVMNCALKTRLGTKIIDVAWFSPQRWQRVQDEIQCSQPPEIGVKIVAIDEMETVVQLKKQLYLEAGVEEVWVCDHRGQMSFHTLKGECHHSLFVYEFPQTVTLAPT